MFQNSGLSLTQAPPIGVVLRFFLIGSIFGVAGGVFLAILGAEFFNFSSSTTLALVHIFTVGVMANFMFGALFQMLPVLASVVIKSPAIKSLLTLLGITVGVLALGAGFIYSSDILLIAGVVLASALLSSSNIMINGLIRVKTHTSSSKGMLFALLNLSSLVLVAVIMIIFRTADIDIPLDYLRLKESHITFGIFGWITLLIMAVSFQVVEMFYVTKPFSKSLANFLGIGISGLLFLKLILIFFAGDFLDKGINILLGIATLVYAILTLKNLFNQKRRVIEATILFWRAGIISLAIFSIIWTVYSLLEIPAIAYTLPHHFFTFVGWFHIIDGGMVIAFFAFAFSIVFAMVYKIVPFLVWFHLNAKGYFNAPMMHEVISPKYSKAHFYFHLVIIAFALISLPFPHLWQGVGVLLSVSFGFIAFALVRAWLKYKDVEKNGQKMEFNFKEA